jgi:superfamily I DNA/RNA helicase
MAEKSSFPTVPYARLFLGTSYTGKSQNLLREIANLLREGADASKILMLCATPDAAQDLSARLKGLCPSAKEVEVTTPRAYFLDLLGTKEACAATGRKARLLLPFEYDFFLEDLKTSGIHPHRLREILRFFYKGLSELADDDEEWLITNEERALFDLMKGCLAFTGAILEPELANLAVNYLRSSKGVLERARKTSVFVDDFQLLSRASQFAACLLAKDCVYLSASQDAALEAYESYPYSDGVDEFIQANPDATFTRLATSYSCHSSAKASCALRQENGIDASAVEVGHLETDEKTSFRLIEGENPQDEIARTVDAVTQLLNSGLFAHDIVIVAPHPVWARHLVCQLRARDVPAEALLDARFLKGDIRRNEKSFNARFLTILSLVADSTDAVAWRCWCGFGDYLTNSNGMRSLRNLGQVQGITLDVVLETSDLQFDVLDGSDAIASIQRIARAQDEARALINRLSGLSGQELLGRIAKELAGPDAQVPEEIRSLVTGCEDDGKGKSAASMVYRARSRVEFPIYKGTDVVRVASYRNVIGLSPRCLFLTGFMNGLFPKHDYFDSTVLTVEQRKKRYAKDLSRIASIVAKASDTLVVSYSKKLDLEDAKRFGLVINRIDFENNKRVAKTEPSIFLKFIWAMQS